VPTAFKRRNDSRNSAKISNSYATDSSINTSNGSLSLINELRRKAAKSVTLAFLGNGEIVGAEEIIRRRGRRQMSVQVTSESCRVLFIEHKDFLDRIYNTHPHIKHLLCEKLELQDKFHSDL